MRRVPGFGELVGLLLKPLGWIVGWLGRVTGFSNEPLLRIAVNHNQWLPGQVDVAGVVVENIGHHRAAATRRAHDIRVRCRVDEDGPFDLYWEGMPPALATDLLEDEPKGLHIAYRWPGPGLFEVNGAHLDSGITHLADGSLELHHLPGMVLGPGAHTLEVVCHYDETGRARARFTLVIPEPDDLESLLELTELSS
jgi:hypothetical protein